MKMLASQAPGPLWILWRHCFGAAWSVARQLYCTSHLYVILKENPGVVNSATMMWRAACARQNSPNKLKMLHSFDLALHLGCVRVHVAVDGSPDTDDMMKLQRGVDAPVSLGALAFWATLIVAHSSGVQFWYHPVCAKAPQRVRFWVSTAGTMSLVVVRECALQLAANDEKDVFEVHPPSRSSVDMAERC